MDKQSLKDLEPIIRESIKDGGQFVFYPSGISMQPTIDGGRDCVVLAEPNNLKKYDLVLYRRQNEQYVLHRIMKIRNHTFTMCGDNQLYFEYNITMPQIIAKVREIRKENGVTIDYNNIRDGLFSLSAKRLLRKLKGKIKRTFKGE